MHASACQRQHRQRTNSAISMILTAVQLDVRALLTATDLPFRASGRGSGRPIGAAPTPDCRIPSAAEGGTAEP
jgi:hypothetical protein